MGDDHLNPALRPSVQRTINKINQLDVMQDPVNRRYILSRLVFELTIVDLAQHISGAMMQFNRLMWSIPLFEDIVTQEDAFISYLTSKMKELVHDFDPLPSRKTPGKHINRCKVCGNSKQHEYHRVPELAP